MELRGLSEPVLGTGGGDLDCLTADDGGITKFPLLLNSRDLEETEVRIAFVYHYLVKFQNLIEYIYSYEQWIYLQKYIEKFYILQTKCNEGGHMDMQLSCNTFITFIELQEALLLMHVNDSFVCQLFLQI